MCIEYDKQRELVRDVVQKLCAGKHAFCARDVARHIQGLADGDQPVNHVSKLVRQQYLIGAMPEGYIMQMMRVPHPKPDSKGSRTFCVYRYSRYAKEYKFNG